MTDFNNSLSLSITVILPSLTSLNPYEHKVQQGKFNSSSRPSSRNGCISSKRLKKVSSERLSKRSRIDNIGWSFCNICNINSSGYILNRQVLA